MEMQVIILDIQTSLKPTFPIIFFKKTPLQFVVGFENIKFNHYTIIFPFFPDLYGMKCFIGHYNGVSD